MSGEIRSEAVLLAMSVYGGAILALCYDAIRILRRVWRRGIILVIIEDVIYWTAASIFIFEIFMRYNYGNTRFFSIAAVLGAMAAYEVLVGRYVVKKASGLFQKIMNTLLKPLKKNVKVIKLKIKEKVCFGKRVKTWLRIKKERHKKEKYTEMNTYPNRKKARRQRG